MDHAIIGVIIKFTTGRDIRPMQSQEEQVNNQADGYQHFPTRFHQTRPNSFFFCCRCSALLVSSMLTTFKSLFISMRAHDFVNVISAVQVDGFTKGQLLRIFGKRLVDYPPSEDQRLSVFDAAWKIISTITNATEYIRAVEPWTEYICVNGRV